MSGLRVALITPEYPGCGPSFGVGTYVRTLAGALARAGARPVVLVCAAAGRFIVEDGMVRRCGGTVASGLLRPLIHAGWLRRQLAETGAEVVEYPNWAGLGAWLGGGVPRVVRLSTPVGSIPLASWRARLPLPWHRRWERRSVLRAQRVIADSAAMAALAEAHYGRPADAIIPHAFAGAIAAQPSSGSDLIAVGRLEARKGTDVLLEAWARVRDRHPGVRLHLVGADADGFGARHLARVGGERVMLHGRLDDQALERLRRSCGIAVVPSRFESFGLVVLEAWAAGLAVVASRAGALGEVVGEAGVLVPPEDAAALGEALSALLSDGARRQELARSGMAKVADRHAPQAYAAATLAAYGQAIAAGCAG
jgi:glycosyltransferase involved in cell wall biosynthesis